MSTVPAKSPPVRTWLYILRLSFYRPWLYLGFGVLEVLFFAVFPELSGLVIRQFFTSLESGISGLSGVPAMSSPYTWAILLVGVAVGRGVAIFLDVIAYFNFRFSVEALLRRNMFERILERPGSTAVPGSPGEAIVRFREDAEEVAFFMAELLTVIAFGVFAVMSVTVMARTDLRITALVLLPLIIVAVTANLAQTGITRYREASRLATGRVTGFIGEIFGAALAIQVNNAEVRVIERFRRLNDERRKTTIKDRMFNELLSSLFRNTASFGTGMVLLLAAQGMRDGAFTVGDLALFAFYIGRLSDFTATLGEKIAWYRRVGVSLERMITLLQGAPPESLVAYKPIYLHGALPEVAQIHSQSVDAFLFDLIQSFQCVVLILNDRFNFNHRYLQLLACGYHIVPALMGKLDRETVAAYCNNTEFDSRNVLH